MATAAGGSPFSVNWLVRRLAQEHIAAAIRTYAGGRLLDLGCGDRPYAGIVGAKVESCVGLEYDRQRYARTPPEVWGSALDLPFREASFDAVLSAQVLEHVPEPERMFCEISRVLKPGGHLILTAPHIWGIHEEPHDYFRFTGYGLSYLARKTGLEPLSARPMAGYWVTAGTRFCYYLQQFEKIGLAVLVRPLYALVQLLSWGLDRVHRIESDAWNFILVARRPARSKGEG